MKKQFHFISFLSILALSTSANSLNNGEKITEIQKYGPASSTLELYLFPEHDILLINVHSNSEKKSLIIQSKKIEEIASAIKPSEFTVRYSRGEIQLISIDQHHFIYLDQGEQNNAEKSIHENIEMFKHRVYGIAKFHNIVSIDEFESILAHRHDFDSSSLCESGGPGAVGCSISDFCKVDCLTGYYACCSESKSCFCY